MRDTQKIEGVGFNDKLDMGNQVENNYEILELLDWVNGDATDENNRCKMRKRFWEKDSE